MKANAGKRKIFDAVDLLTEDTSAQTTEVNTENGVELIAIDTIKAFHNHPFHLYEGERLNDMVESIREHGVLNPVIVLKTDDGYEMLSGHNRANAAKIAGLSKVPAIIKVGLSESEAYVYVIETNLMQRSFAELLPSEKAAVMAAHYDKVCCQGKRNDIIINGGAPKYSVSLIIPKSDTKTIEKIQAAIQAAYDEGQGKLKGNGKSVPALSVLKTPLRDGDAERPDDEAYADSYFINANSGTAPGIVDADRQPILERSEVYSGVYGRASINFYAFNSNGNKGIACGLNNLQKIKDGEPLGGKSRAEDDFDTEEDDDFLS